MREGFGFTATYNHLSPTEIGQMCERRGTMIETRQTPGFVHGHSLIIEYRADGPGPDYLNRWRPSIHMPRWASRVTLDVLDVRVERVQAITEADALAEGVVVTEGLANLEQAFTDFRPDVPRIPAAVQGFCELWNRINGPRGFDWDSDPWVWKVTFRLLEGATAPPPPD